MKFSILLTLALSYTTLSSAQNFRRDNADKAEQLTREFAKLTKDSPCENNAQACVENQFAQCVNGKFQLNSCGGGELKCVVLPLVNKAGTSITCSTEADRLARLADARGEPPPNQGKSKNGILPPDSEQDNGKNGKLPPNEGDGKDENTPPELGKGKNGKSPPDNLCKCPGNDNGKDGNDNGKDDNDNGKDGNDNGKDGNDNGKDGNDNDTENGDGNDDGKDNGDGNENDGIDNGDGNGKDENDNGKDENDNGKDENDNGKDENDNAKDGNVPDNQDTPKNPDNVQTPPANGDGNLADIRRQNAAEARALQEKFDQLKPDDECNDNEVACVENKFAQCSGGKFALTDCASGTICAALPLVLKKGTTVACTTEADRDARLKQAESNTK